MWKVSLDLITAQNMTEVTAVYIHGSQNIFYMFHQDFTKMLKSIHPCYNAINVFLSVVELEKKDFYNLKIPKGTCT